MASLFDEGAEAERQRLDDCVREPIRTPGSIQSHGVLLALGPDARTVALASENCSQAFGIGPDDMLGSDLDALVGDSAATAVRGIALGASNSSNPISVSLLGEQWDVIVHSSGSMIVVEFEPWLRAGHSPAASTVFEAIHRLSLLSTVDQLRRETVRTVRHLTGFDRVLLYNFSPDGHGEVVAEEHGAGMEPYLGLHFPASDIPAQARDLYLTKLSRSIVNTERPISGLRVIADSPATTGLDLSLAELRSVSPYHLQFMRNMGQVATLSFSLIREGELIGMITCAHRSERRLPFLVRAGLEVLANQIALQLASMEEIVLLKEASRVRELRTVLVRQFEESEVQLEALLAGAVTLFDVVPAEGAVCSIGGVARSFGIAPSVEEFEAALPSASRDLIATDSLVSEHPGLAEAWPAVAGLLVVPVGPTDYVALFRREVIRTVDWLGDQSLANRFHPLSPRLSFSSWTQRVKGTASPWGASTRDARELGRELESALARRAESHLAVAALVDALTGLPNRRFLQQRLTSQLERPQGSTALFFIDLDRFKIINDSRGHDVGDELLVQVAGRLAAVARQEDTVARLGGDEFVLICGNTTLEHARTVADRILTSLREPIEIGGHAFTVSASIGIAVAVPGHTAADLLKLADISMYRAKADGGDRASA